MAQFDVYINNSPKSKDLFPYFLDIQNDILKHIDTRVIIPLSSLNLQNKSLNPSFKIDNKNLILASTEITNIHKSILGNKVCSLENKKAEIISSIDFLITGF